MPQQTIPDPLLLFKIDIKVGQRIITLNVKQGDTIQAILLQHKMGNKSNTQKFEQLKQKIKTNIQKQMQIKIYSNQLELASKMQAFLLKQNQQKQSQSTNKQFQRTQNRLNQKVLPSQTPFKLLFEKTLTQVREQSRQSFSLEEDEIQHPNNLANQDQCQPSVLKEVSLVKNITKPSKSKVSVSLSSKQKAKTQKQVQSHKKSASHQMDQDLIKAYEVIWKKSKDKTMREMAENTLKELNVILQDDKITEFLPSDFQKKQKQNIGYTRNEQSMNSLTPIQKNQKQPILQDPQSRSFMRRNYRYSYLESNSNLNYPYEKAEKSNEKYSYNRLDQTYVNILNKDYDQKNYQKIHIQPNGNRRYSYLDD